jgi:hypothetical protein
VTPKKEEKGGSLEERAMVEAIRNERGLKPILKKYF